MNPSTEQPPSMPVPAQPAPAQGVPPVIASTPLPGGQSAGVDPNPVAGATPQAAQDSDLIEKEWVIKAKQIVLATLHDPYEQNRQLAALKADYMQKRYNKVVKLSE